MEIHCEFKSYPWEIIAPKMAYTCNVELCHITSRGVEITGFKGQHEASKNNNSVKALSFKDTTVHFIPKNLTKVFPNLVYFEINNCGLKEVTAEDLIGLEKLEDLSLCFNRLTSLPVNLFKHMPKLRETYLGGNLIRKLDLKVLEPIKDRIEVFDIIDNPGISEKYEKKTHEFGDFIKRLKLSEDKIKTEKSFDKISKRFGALFVTGKYSDFIIKVRDKEYRVHKCILASQSTVFDQMFSDDLEDAEEAANKIIITRSSQEAFEEFLRFFYTKIISSQEFVVELLELAVEFDVTDLKLQCETVLNQTIDPGNALQLYNLAVGESLEELKRTAFEALKECHSEIKEFLFEKPQLVHDIIEAKIDFLMANQNQLEEQATNQIKLEDNDEEMPQDEPTTSGTSEMQENKPKKFKRGHFTFGQGCIRRVNSRSYAN